MYRHGVLKYFSLGKAENKNASSYCGVCERNVCGTIGAECPQNKRMHRRDSSCGQRLRTIQRNEEGSAEEMNGV